MEKSIEIPPKIKTRTTVWSQLFYLWVYTQRTQKTLIPKDTCPIHCSIINNNQDMETTKMSIDGWIKMWYTQAHVYTHTHTHTHTLLFNHKWSPSFAATWMGPASIMLSEIVRQRKTNGVWLHSYVKSKKIKWTNKRERNQAQIQRTDYLVTRGEGVWGVPEISNEGQLLRR